MHSTYLDAIRGFEGFTSKADWDYAQFSNGYGTRAKFAGEVIDKAEADRRFAAEIAEARSIVERHAPDAPEGAKAALTSLTFNAGDTWTRSGLGEAVRAGDIEKARELFLQYNKAGGEVLPGLVKRRIAEAAWIVGGGASNPIDGAAAPLSADAASQPPTAATRAVAQASDEAASSASREGGFDLTAVEQSNDGGTEASAEQLIRAAVSSFGGEAKLTQLLLAAQFINARSAEDDSDRRAPGGEPAAS